MPLTVSLLASHIDPSTVLHTVHSATLTLVYSTKTAKTSKNRTAIQTRLKFFSDPWPRVLSAIFEKFPEFFGNFGKYWGNFKNFRMNFKTILNFIKILWNKWEYVQLVQNEISVRTSVEWMKNLQQASNELQRSY